MVGTNRTDRTANRRPLAADPPLNLDPPGPAAFVCEHCTGRSFTTSSGLGLHLRRAHPLEANRAIRVERVKARWSEEEMRLMAKAEAEHVCSGSRDPINQYLVGLYPHRTLEAIKGKRRDGVAYRPLVREYVAQLQAAQPEVVASPGTSSHDEDGREQRATDQPRRGANWSANWQDPLREELIRLCRSTDWEPLGVEVETLNELVQRACAGEDVAEEMLVFLTRHIPRTEDRPIRTEPQPTPIAENASRKEKKSNRSETYRRTQGLYRNNERVAVERILDGEASHRGGLPVPAGDFREYWRNLLETPGAPLESDRHPIIEPSVAADHLWDPISVEEIGRCEAKRNTAHGPDGISSGEWRKVPRPVVALLFNTILLGARVPSSLLTARTVFIPKGCPQGPGDFRPLTITSVIMRHLHRILAARLTAIPGLVSARQKAFRPGVDGIAENFALLSHILTESRRSVRTVHVASLDVSKAFDTVSHAAILETVARAGLPLPFAEYLRTVYAKSATTLEVGARSTRSLLVHPARGVKQGDPLSPILFCMVIERALEKLDAEVGFEVSVDQRVNAVAFADDVVLIASTSQGLQRNLDLFSGELRRFGLLINPSKSRALSLVASGREKKVKVVEDPRFTVGDRRLPQTSPIELWRHLGVHFEGSRVGVAADGLRVALERLSKAPLKPQQRLHILRNYVFPRFVFAWTFGRVSAGYLRELDRVTRKTVRKWLRLPDDTPIGYFHCPLKAGGLGVPQLALYIPYIRHQRFAALARSSDGAVRAVANSNHFQRQLEWCRDRLAPVLPLELGVSLKALEGVWTGMLYNSSDGRGLSDSGQCRFSTDWLRCKTNAIPARDYIHYHHVHINAIPSRTRVLRGRAPNAVAQHCRAGCLEDETPAHVLQRCWRTRGGRSLRHDHLVRAAAKGLREIGFKVATEKSFSTRVGNRKPDLVAVRDGRAAVIDAQVVGSSFDLEVAHRNKIRKYAVEAQLAPLVVDAYAGTACGRGLTTDKVSFTSLTISWRGVWSRSSAESLLELGLPGRLLRQLTTMALWGSWMNWRRFNSGTAIRMGGDWNVPEEPEVQYLARLPGA